MPSLTKAAAKLAADLPEPHSIIAWHALSLFTALRTDETLIALDRRADIAALLDETGRECLLAAARLKHTPAGAEALRHIQAKEPRHHSAN
jgi:hypothetical protein